MKTLTSRSRFCNLKPRPPVNRPFGQGIETRPASWVAIARRREAEAYDRMIDQLAIDSANQDRYEAGILF